MEIALEISRLISDSCCAGSAPIGIIQRIREHGAAIGSNYLQVGSLISRPNDLSQARPTTRGKHTTPGREQKRQRMPRGRRGYLVVMRYGSRSCRRT